MAAVEVAEVEAVAEARLPEVEAGCPAPLPIAAAAAVAPPAGSTDSTACSSGIRRKRHTDPDRRQHSIARIVHCSPLHPVDPRRLASPHRQHLPLLPWDS